MKKIDVTEGLEPFKALIPLDLSRVEYIILHHTECVKCTWEDLNKWHKANGWNCAGYNEFVCKDGTVYILRGDNIGAHCMSYNSKSYGIAVEGNYQTEEQMPQAQFESLIQRIKFNKQRFKNYKETYPHSQFYPTSCCGQFFPLAKVISAVNTLDRDLILDSAIEKLVKHKFISTPEFWRINSKIGGIVYGEYVALLFKNVARYFVDMSIPVITVETALDILKDNGLELQSPEYWLENSVPNGKVDGEYMAILLKKLGYLV